MFSYVTSSTINPANNKLIGDSHRCVPIFTICCCRLREKTFQLVIQTAGWNLIPKTGWFLSKPAQLMQNKPCQIPLPQTFIGSRMKFTAAQLFVFFLLRVSVVLLSAQFYSNFPRMSLYPTRALKGVKLSPLAAIFCHLLFNKWPHGVSMKAKNNRVELSRGPALCKTHVVNKKSTSSTLPAACQGCYNYSSHCDILG